MAAMYSFCEKLVFWDLVTLSSQDKQALHSMVEKIAPALKYALGRFEKSENNIIIMCT